jgi:hypothetical protein
MDDVYVTTQGEEWTGVCFSVRHSLGAADLTRALFSFQIFLVLVTVVFSFLFINYYPIMN